MGRDFVFRLTEKQNLEKGLIELSLVVAASVWFSRQSLTKVSSTTYNGFEVDILPQIPECWNFRLLSPQPVSLKAIRREISSVMTLNILEYMHMLYAYKHSHAHE